MKKLILSLIVLTAVSCASTFKNDDRYPNQVTGDFGKGGEDQLSADYVPLSKEKVLAYQALFHQTLIPDVTVLYKCFDSDGKPLTENRGSAFAVLKYADKGWINSTGQNPFLVFQTREPHPHNDKSEFAKVFVSPDKKTIESISYKRIFSGDSVRVTGDLANPVTYTEKYKNIFTSKCAR